MFSMSTTADYIQCLQYGKHRREREVEDLNNRWRRHILCSQVRFYVLKNQVMITVLLCLKMGFWFVVVVEDLLCAIHIIKAS